jgi:bacteriocin-like protein
MIAQSEPMETAMQKQDIIKELTGNELEQVSGGMTDTGKSTSDTIWDILKTILHIPTSLPGGTHRK